MNATDRFSLTVMGRATVNGTRYVLYSDGHYCSVVEADSFDADTDATDYSLWCSQECHAIGDLKTVVAVLDATGVERIRDAILGSVHSTAWAAHLAEELDDSDEE